MASLGSRVRTIFLVLALTSTVMAVIGCSSTTDTTYTSRRVRTHEKIKVTGGSFVETECTTFNSRTRGE